jgi:hypothetical protein
LPVASKKAKQPGVNIATGIVLTDHEQLTTFSEQRPLTKTPAFTRAGVKR